MAFWWYWCRCCCCCCRGASLHAVYPYSRRKPWSQPGVELMTYHLHRNRKIIKPGIRAGESTSKTSPYSTAGIAKEWQTRHCKSDGFRSAIVQCELFSKRPGNATHADRPVGRRNTKTQATQKTTFTDHLGHLRPRGLHRETITIAII